MNLRSLEKVNLRAASIRSNGSSESLMLFIKAYQLLIPCECNPVSAEQPNVRLTLRRGPGDPNNANIPKGGVREDSFWGFAAECTGTHQVRDGLQQRCGER